MLKPLNFSGILDHIDDKSKGNKLTMGDIVESLGSRGYGPLLLAIAIIELLPTGSIPGVPTLLAIVIILFAGQMVAGRATPWIPQKLRGAGVDKEKFDKARDKIRPTLQKMDKILKPRLEQLTSPIAARLVGGICILLALTMPFLEVIPMASSIPSALIGLYGIGLSARDGLIILLVSILTLSVAGGATYWLAF